MIAMLFQFAVSVAPQIPGAPSAACEVPTQGIEVPTLFDGDRIFAKWRLVNGEELHLYTDTGGGMISLYPQALQRLQAVTGIDYAPRRQSGDGRRLARIPFRDAPATFPPIPTRDSVASLLLVEEEPPPTERSDGPRWDGRLGAYWFFNRVWTFDYPHQRLLYHGRESPGNIAPECWVELGFQRDSTGRTINLFPRIAAEIAGETLQFLVDTGARTELTHPARDLIRDSSPAQRAASFIGEEVFDRWRTLHPDWTLIERAEAGTDSSGMIQVPEVRIGRQTLGPVWFTRRPRSAFPDFMSAYTDRPVVGALGGSAWRYGALVLDYPRSRAAFIRY